MTFTYIAPGILSDGQGWSGLPTDPYVADWLAQGNTPAPYVAPLPGVADYENAVQSTLDAYAAAKGYQDGTTLATYDSSTTPSWSAEAHAFIVWRDACWALAYGMLQQVNTGKIPQPTVAALVAALPPHP